jgi:hypothetical protein
MSLFDALIERIRSIPASGKYFFANDIRRKNITMYILLLDDDHIGFEADSKKDAKILEALVSKIYTHSGEGYLKEYFEKKIKCLQEDIDIFLDSLIDGEVGFEERNIEEIEDELFSAESYADEDHYAINIWNGRKVAKLLSIKLK